MKKMIMALAILLTTSVSGYYIFVWNPKSVAVEANVEEKEDITTKESEKNKENVLKSIMKDSNKSIAENMISEDKDNIKQYSQKLSVIDSALIEEYMNGKLDETSVKEMVRIFKNRFDEDQYKEVKTIFSKYIDINSIEKML